MAWRNESRFVPEVRMESRAMAKILRSVSSWNGGSSGGTYCTLPMPCMPPMSAMVSTGSPPAISKDHGSPQPRSGGARDGSDGPGVDLEGAGPPRGQGGVEHVQR